MIKDEPTATPILTLLCVACGHSMPRHIARGLLIGDGIVTVQVGFIQECVACGHLHQPGAQLRYKMWSEKEQA